MFQVRMVFHTWKNGLQLFCKTGNVRNQYRPAKATCGQSRFYKMLSATQRTYAHRCRTGLKNQGQRHKIFTTMSLLYAYKRLWAE